MAKTIKVKLGFIYARLQKLIQFGKDHDIRAGSGVIKKAAVAKRIVDEMLDIHFDPVTANIRETEGVTTLSMTRKLWADYAESRGYIKKR